MRKAKKSIYLLLLFLSLLSCNSSQKILALKPNADMASPLVYENSVSTISMPVHIKIQEIQNQVNNVLSGLIYEDAIIEDDNYTVKVWKKAPITLKNIAGNIETVLPLRAIVNYRIGTNKFGVNLYTSREIKLDGIVTLRSEVALDNWKLNSKTQLFSLTWNETPTMLLAGKSIPITYAIDPALKLFKNKIERNIDDAIKKSMDFKPQVLNVLEKICDPLQINQQYNTWLRIVPIALNSTSALLKNQSVELVLGLKCTIETIVGARPVSKFDRSKTLLSPASKINNGVEANIVAVSAYADASQVINNNFRNQTFGDGGKKVTVKNVEIWHKDGKLVVALELNGSLNGTIYLIGVPTYNQQTKEITFEQLEYTLDTKNKLIKTASWLASGTILKKLQQTCKYSIKSNLEEGKQSMLQYLSNYAPMPGVFVNGSINDIDFQKIQLTNSAIVAFLKVTGNMNVTVDGMQ